MGHLLARSHPSDATITKAMITGIYAFHMPAFVFLAGITSKPRGIAKRCVQFLTLLAVFEAAFFWVRRLMGSEAPFNWESPYWLLWFLLSMTVWTLVTPLIAKAPRASLVASIVISLVAGMIDWVGYPFSVSRTLVFLPFFVAGFTHGKSVLAYISKLHTRGRGVIFGVAVLVFGILLYWKPKHSWFYGSKGYEVLDVSDLSGVAHRLVFQLVAVVFTVGMLVLIPRQPNLLTRYGERSLSIYLLHGFAIMVLGRYVSDMAKDNVWVAVGILVVLAAGIAVLTSMQPVHRLIVRIGTLFVPLVDWLGSLMSRKPSGSAATVEPPASSTSGQGDTSADGQLASAEGRINDVDPR